MKPQAGSVLTGHDAEALSGRWAALLVVLALLAVGSAGIAGYSGLASGLMSPGEARPEAPPGSETTTASPPKPETVPLGPGQETTSRTPESVRLPASAAASTSELRWPLWEFQLRQPIPPREPPLTPPPWRLVGSATSGPVKQLIILRQGKTAPEFYVQGDSLPGGYVVGEITDEGVTLIHGKRALSLSFIGIR